MNVDWAGVYPAATTAFRADESLDLAAVVKHLDFLARAGVHGLVVLGTVGESASLSYEEKLDVLRAAVDVADIPVIAGVSQTTTREAVRFARDAETAGVDGLMVLPATLYPSDARETVAHFRSVARASGLPVLCYNNPVAYGVDLTPRMFAELADEKTLVAIKESSDDPRRITDLVNEVGDRYAILGGVDDLVLESAMLGARGWISGLTNAFPRESLALWDLAVSGRWDEAVKLYRWFTPLLHLDAHPKLVQYIKLAMAEAGLGTETCRAPRLRLEGEERARVLDLIRKAVAHAAAR
ncbi:MAG TPA: dihydrodipicolinate synthase family protein [Planctomycetota bacterium]